MNLAEFVEESLSEILTGIRSAQKKEGGGAIGAEMSAATDKGLLVAAGAAQLPLSISMCPSWLKTKQVGKAD